jgi:hypothetical protein
MFCKTKETKIRISKHKRVSKSTKEKKALTLAAVAASKAFLKASSSASSDEMRALAIARASAVHQGGKEKSSKEAKKAIQDKQIKEKKFILRGLSSLQSCEQQLPS